MAFTEAQLLEWLGGWLWPGVRISGFIMTAPVIGTRSVPARAKVILLLALVMVIVPILPPVPDYPLFGGVGVLTTIQQFIVGAALGLTVRLVFTVLELAGQVIAMQMGLGFAAMVDPQNGNQVPVVSQFYIVVATLLFLSFNGHLALVQILVESFEVLPVSTRGLAPAGIDIALDWMGWLIAQAILVSLPAVTALLLVNFAFGIMTRAAPQLNIFAVGFPVMIMGGMGIALLTMATLVEQVQGLFERALGSALAVLGAG
jgi:flagellar biosynthesis protein FliR